MITSRQSFYKLESLKCVIHVYDLILSAQDFAQRFKIVIQNNTKCCNGGGGGLFQNGIHM